MYSMKSVVSKVCSPLIIKLREVLLIPQLHACMQIFPVENKTHYIMHSELCAEDEHASSAGEHNVIGSHVPPTWFL